MSIFSDLKIPLNTYANFLIAYSGGLDSTVLLFLLKKLRDENTNLKIRAIHVHHGLSPNANFWVHHCKTQCKNWGIPLIVKYIHLKNNKLGIEGAARVKRYDIFFSNLNLNEVLLTGHNLNDQCETLLLALKRGSGPRGLGGMKKITKKKEKILYRPFLNYSRKTLKNIAKKNHLFWIEDESNQNLNFDRNFLRYKIFPIFEKKWPYFLNTIARTSELCTEEHKALNEFISTHIANLIQKDGALSIASLKNLSLVQNYAIIRYWLQRQGCIMPSRKVLKCIWYNLIHSRIDAKPCIKIGNFEIRRCHQTIYLTPIKNFSFKN